MLEERGFNPRSPAGERRIAVYQVFGIVAVSIHAPPRGSDSPGMLKNYLIAVSIHAPPRGSDTHRARPPGDTMRFNPRSPAGERRSTEIAGSILRSFNPRSPAGERQSASEVSEK